MYKGLMEGWEPEDVYCHGNCGRCDSCDIIAEQKGDEEYDRWECDETGKIIKENG